MDIIKNQIEAYKNNFIKFKNSPRGTFQNDEETQYLRFHRLIMQINLDRNIKIHDVGCGICDMYDYLNKNGLKNINYSGTEIVPEMVEFARKKYTSIKIFNQDILNVTGIKYDYLVLSGVFNLPGNVERKKWKSFCFKMIDKMYELTDIAISFNFLSANNTFSAPELFYINPVEVFDYCLKNYSRFVYLDNAYPLYEFTVTVFKTEAIKNQFPSPPFNKYFN